MSKLFGANFENRLTEKKMSDRRFRDNEKRILSAYYSKDNHISVEKMTRLAKMSKSTFYRHHKGVGQVSQDYADYLLRQFNSSVGELARSKNTKIKRIYIGMLFFIMQHRDELRILQQSEDRKLYAQMIAILKDKIASAEKLPNDHDKMFMVYTGEIVELLCAWGEEGFLLRKADTVLRDIMYLTNSMKSRLDSLRLEEVKDGVMAAGGDMVGEGDGGVPTRNTLGERGAPGKRNGK